MKARRPVASLLLWVVMASLALAQTDPATGHALLMSDIHLDPLADPAIVKRLIAAPAAQWEGIFENSNPKSFSTYGADTNYALFVSTLTAAVGQSEFDYVVFTGDALRHNFAQAFIAAGGTSAEFPEFAAKTEEFVIRELQERLKIPVLTALGNNDSGCGDYQIPPDSAFLTETANAMAVLNASPEAKSTFQLGGYFAIAHPTVAYQEVLVLNSIFWSASYKSCAPNSGDPGKAELEWLSWKLYNARLLHHGVTLVMHIPPGMDAYNSAHGQCQSPTSFWQAKYSTEFSALMSSYGDVVQMAFAGHLHMDDFRVIPAASTSLPVRITPSVSPIYKNDPAFSVMTYNLSTAAVSDITTFFLTLSSRTPSWSKEYGFDGAYRVSSFSAASLSTVVAAIRNKDGSSRTTFERNYAVSTPSPIHRSNFLFYSCAQSFFTARSYSDCVCGAVSPPEQKAAP